jgi:hypothetical protein
MNDDDQAHRPAAAAETPTEAIRQGRTFGSVRWVLGLSLALVVMGLLAVWIVMAP